MIRLVGDKLKELGLKVQWQSRPDSKLPNITFSFINENGEVFADDSEIETRITCQVDVWSEDDYTDIVDQVKSKMKEIGFYRISAYDSYEKDVNIYHKILRFSYLKESEE